ncbi:mediator complex subunit MED14-domain-containing protein [Globomyces pollinis-pini]|nr:mediator complex subunit MED14-domain-containing protein [Globomyces pollinis-pini]
MELTNEQTIPFSTLLNYSIQSCLSDLNSLLKNNLNIIELLPFLKKFRLLFIKLLAIYRLPLIPSLPKLHSIIDNQDIAIEKCANDLFLFHNQLKSAKLLAPDLFTAIDILTTGNYRQLPTIIKSRYINSPPPNQNETIEALTKLENIMRIRLFCTESLPHQLKTGMSIADGCVSFTVPDEFHVSLALLLTDNPTWRIMKLEFLCESEADKKAGTGLNPNQINFIQQDIQSKLEQNPSNRVLWDLYDQLHLFCLKFQLQVLTTQSQTLSQTRWKGNLIVNFDKDLLKLTFWKKNDQSFHQLWISCSPKPNTELFNNALDSHQTDLLKCIVDSVEKESSSCQKLTVQLYRFENDTTAANESKTLLDQFALTSLDIETILLQVTHKLSNELIENWKLIFENTNIVVQSPNTSTDLNPLPNLMINFYNSYSIHLVIDPRSGKINMQMMDLLKVGVSSDGKRLIDDALKNQESRLNSDPTVLKKVCQSLVSAIRLQALEMVAHQSGFNSVLDPSAFLASETKSDETLYSIFLKSESLMSHYLSISASENYHQSQLDTFESAFKVTLYLIGTDLIDQSVSLEIKPADLNHLMDLEKTHKQLHWMNIRSNDINCIQRFCSHYILFSNLVKELKMLKIPYNYVIPGNVSLQDQTETSIKARNPILSMNLTDICHTESSNIETSKIYSAKKITTNVFVKLETKDNQIVYQSFIRLPSQMHKWVNVRHEDPHIQYDSQRHCFCFTYVSLEDFKTKFYNHCSIIQHLLQLSVQLLEYTSLLGQRKIQVSFMVNPMFLVIATEHGRLAISWSKKAGIEKGYEWKVKADFGIKSGFQTLMSTYVENALKRHDRLIYIVEYLCDVAPVIKEVDQLKDIYGDQITIVAQSISSLYIVSHSYGFQINFLNKLIEIRDCILNDTLKTELKLKLVPLLRHTEQMTTLLDTITGRALTTPQQIVIPMRDAMKMLNAIELYFDLLTTFNHLKTYLETVSTRIRLALQTENLRLLVSIDESDNFIFQGSLTENFTVLKSNKYSDDYKVQLQQEYNRFCKYVLDMVHVLPIRERHLFHWLKMLHLVTRLPESVMLEVIGIRKFILNFPNWDLLVQVPTDSSIYMFNPGMPCMTIDTNLTLIRVAVMLLF